jgi:hypothetical protein
MPSTIIIKNSSTASAVPSAGSLVAGELAINTADKKIYAKDNTGAVTLMSSATMVADASASAILANDWATKTSGPVAGGEYSAKYNAQAAATSASNASTSASNASSAQTAAEAARDATLAAYDSFDDRYLGTKAADPTLDNDGNALLAGALYFNSVSQLMKLYTGTAWVAAYVSGEGFVTLTGTETLTNKTLTAPVLTTPNITSGLTLTGAAGTSGQVLTSGGSGVVPTWTTPVSAGAGGTTASGNVTLTSASSGSQAITPTGFGQTVTLPNATTLSKAACLFNIANTGNFPLRVANSAGTLLGFIYPNDSVVIGLADNSTAAGVWTDSGLDPMAVTANFSNRTLTVCANLYGATVIDSTRTFVFFGVAAATYGVVFDSTTGTFGTATLIFTGNTTQGKSILSATNQVLCLYSSSNTLYSVVVSISGTTITVNTAASQVLAATIVSMSNLVAVGTSYVVATHLNSSTTGLNAFTISGTTVTIGTRVVMTGTAGTSNAWQIVLYVPNANKVLAFYGNNVEANNYALLANVSGTTITVNTAGAFGYASTGYRTAPMGANWVIFYYATAGNIAATIITVSGNSLGYSTANIGFPSTSFGADFLSNADVVMVSATKAVVFFLNGCNILTNTSGTASVGTPATYTRSTQMGYMAALGFSGNYASVVYESNFYNIHKVVFDISGTSPVLFDSSHVQFRTQNNTSTSRTASVFLPSTVSCSHNPVTFLGSVAIAADIGTFPIVTAAPLAGSGIYKSSTKISSMVLGNYVTLFDADSSNKTLSWLGSSVPFNPDGATTGVLIQRIESAA